MGVIFSAVISLSAAERNCARQALKGLRNGISCSTGSALTLAIVRIYYRLLAAKGDNAASRSGKTQAFSTGTSRRKSLLAARVGVSGVTRDLWITKPVIPLLARGSRSHRAPELEGTCLERAAHCCAPLGSQCLQAGHCTTSLGTCSRNSCLGEERSLFLCSTASR